MQLHYMEQPRWGDLDVNQHVNVKYIGWILEVISSGPTTFILFSGHCPGHVVAVNISLA